MATLRKVKAVVLGHNNDMEKTAAELTAAGIPTSSADCRGCADPCEEGHDEWPKKFDVDRETQMLGNVKPYRRQVVISTAKKDWVHEISDEKDSLAAYLNKAQQAQSRSFPSSGSSAVPGVFASDHNGRIAVLNGSHRSVSNDEAEQSVLVFPDYTVVNNVKKSEEGASELWSHSLDPFIPFGGKASSSDQLQTKVIPYSCVILLCSHKKRDARCSIAAPKLEAAFRHSLHHQGWGVDVLLDEGVLHEQHPLEELTGSTEEREAEYKARLKSAADGTLGREKKALVVYNSHMGGHKFAGNVIIHTPNGTGIWYGRVSTHEVESVVVNTILGGKILPPLLRGGMNLQRPGCSSLNDW